MRIRLRSRRERWPQVIPIYDGRQCPECGAVVISWSGQWQHQSFHDELSGAPEETPVPDGYVVGGAMAPADVPGYASDDDTGEGGYWGG